MDKKLLWTIHNWIGVYCGVVIAFLSITGAAALFRPEVDRLLNPHLTKVAAQDSTVSLATTVQEVLKAHPDMQLFEVEMPKAYLDTWNIRLRANEPDAFYPMFWEVFVNPYTGEIRGERNYYETFSYFLRNLHVRFYEGQFGRQIVGLAGIALLISTITGLLIYGKFMKKQPFGNIRRKNLRITQADLHKLIGMSALLFNLIIAITGAWLGLQSYLMEGLDIKMPNEFIRSEKPLTKEEDTHYALDYDAIVSKTKEEFPELQPWYIRPTTTGEGLVHVYGNVAGQVYERRSNKLVFDKADYSIEHRYNISDQDFSAKLYYVQEALHFGDYAGLPIKLFYCILALSSGFLSLSGFIIYLERIKKQRQKEDALALKPLLLRWTAGMMAFIVLIGILSLRYGIGIPSLIVTTATYGFLLIVILRKLFLLGSRHFHSTQKKEYEKTT
ncbi:PepSY-associated TM helix domain-containing protein [Echinicola sediminis]